MWGNGAVLVPGTSCTYRPRKSEPQSDLSLARIACLSSSQEWTIGSLGRSRDQFPMCPATERPQLRSLPTHLLPFQYRLFPQTSFLECQLPCLMSCFCTLHRCWPLPKTPSHPSSPPQSSLFLCRPPASSPPPPTSSLSPLFLPPQAHSRSELSASSLHLPCFSSLFPFEETDLSFHSHLHVWPPLDNKPLLLPQAWRSSDWPSCAVAKRSCVGVR